MRILKNIFLFLMLVTASVSSAQLTISTEGGEAAQGSQLEVDITANMFNELATFQFNVVWDSMVMEFVEVKNVNSDLPSYSVNTNFGLPGDGSINDGTVSTSWTDFAQARSLANDTRLFTIVLNAIGAECATSSFGFDNEEAGDGNFLEVTVTSIGGDILVSGPDCGDGGDGGGDGNDDCVNECEGSTDVILSMPCITAPAGSNICIPITVFNFTNIEAVQTGIVWDPSVMTYTGFQNLGFDSNEQNAGFIFNDLSSDEGMVRQFWAEQTGGAPQTLSDGSVLYEMCFDLTGNDGDMTDVDFDDIGNFGVEIVQDGVGVPFCLDQGKVTIGTIVGDPVMLIANDVSADQNTEACLDITVRNFTDIRGYQANLQWNNSILAYNRVQMLNASLGLTQSNFNFSTNPDNLRFTWDNLTPATLDDNAKLFEICFDVVGDCESTPTSAVTFESTPSSDIEFSDPAGMGLPFELTNGSVTVLPCAEEHSCNADGIIQPACNGDTGSISVTVDADETCECNWFVDGGSTSIQTTPGNGNCNLSNVGAGSYTFELSDASGTVVCTFTSEIIEPSAITTNPSVTNAGCGDTGAITLNAAGGTGMLSYSWNPAVSTSDSATDLPAGDYTIMIFDENDCSVTVDLAITSVMDELIFDVNSSTVNNPLCNGGTDGSIMGAAMGGCPPYTFAYEGGDGTGLSAGTYGVTVTDSQGAEASGSLTLTDPLEIDITATTVNPTVGSSNGSITISATNGVEPYSYAWDPNVSSANIAAELAAGFYSVTVTDANGCMVVQNNIELISNPGGNPEVSEINVVDVTGCFGDNNGSISGMISGGDGALTIELTGPTSETISLAGAGLFSFDELTGGTYDITVTDSNGQIGTAENIVLDQPDVIDVIVTTGDDNNNNCDGFIDVIVTGGTEPYTYSWVNLDDTTEDLSNLCGGFYDLVVTDANGCVAMEMDIEVEIVGDPIGPCWIANKVITPNDDGLNDFFEFSCINDRNASLEIFDRYGRQVYTNPNYDNEFNGISDSGVTLGEGGYMWVLNIDFGDQGRQVEQGTLTLLRD